MLDTLTAECLILASWSVMALVLVGTGLEFARISGSMPVTDGNTVWKAFWAGFAVTIGWLQVWHLFLPADGWAFVFASLLSLPGWWLSGRNVLAWGTSWVSRHRTSALMVVLWCVYLAHRASGPPTGDARFYLSTVACDHGFAIIPGVARANIDLGFNLPSLLWFAMLDSGPWIGRSAHLGNSLLIGAIGARSLIGLRHLFTRGVDASVADRYFAFLCIPIMAQSITLLELRVSSTDTDTSVAMVCFALMGEWIRIWNRDCATSQVEPGALCISIEELIWLTTLTSILGTLKLSAAPLAAMCLIFQWAWWCLQSGFRRWDKIRPLGYSVAIAILVAAVWLVRSTILSGYPLYPSLLVRFAVPWALSPEQAAVPLASFRSTFFDKPLFHQLVPGYTHWIFPFLYWQATRSPDLILLPACIAVAAIAARTVAFVRRRVPMQDLWILLPFAAAMLLWISTIPEPRYAYHLFWISAAVVASAWLGFPSINTLQSNAMARWTGRGIILLVVMVPMHRLAAWTAAHQPRRTMATLVLPPGSDHGLYPAPEHWYPQLVPPEQILTLPEYLNGNPEHKPFITQYREDSLAPDLGVGPDQP